MQHTLDLVMAIPAVIITLLVVGAYALGRTVERMKNEQRDAQLARIQRGQRASG
jgi:Tfp pilus assembly protein PilX